MSVPVRQTNTDWTDCLMRVSTFWSILSTPTRWLNSSMYLMLQQTEETMSSGSLCNSNRTRSSNKCCTQLRSAEEPPLTKWPTPRLRRL